MVSHKISMNFLPFDVRADFVKVTSDTVLVPITIQVKNKDVTWVEQGRRAADDGQYLRARDHPDRPHRANL